MIVKARRNRRIVVARLKVQSITRFKLAVSRQVRERASNGRCSLHLGRIVERPFKLNRKHVTEIRTCCVT